METILKNKSSVFFIFITVLYLILEVSFRANMLNVSSTIKDIIEVEAVEVTGRFLASFGFVIFVLSNLSFKNKILKFTLFPLIGVLAFGGFYQAQSLLIDSIGKNFTPEEKKAMSLLQMDK